MNNVAAQILKKLSIYNTKPRVLILNMFLDAKTTLDYLTLKKYIGKEIDRGTIYRTLYLFLEKNLLYTIPSEDGIIHYALQLNKSITKRRVHFVCSKCKKIINLPDSSMPEIKISERLKVENIDVLLSGICDECDK